MSDPTTGGMSSTNLLMVCPSLGKECGISRYSTYAHDACGTRFGSTRLVSSTTEAFEICKNLAGPIVVILQLEYGILDFNGDLSSNETTAEAIYNLRNIQNIAKGIRTAVIMHTVVSTDHVINAYNKQWFNSGIPVYCMNREGAIAANINFLEQGIPGLNTQFTLQEPKGGEFSIGSFGFLSANKDFESVLELCAATDVSIKANFACSDDTRIARVVKRAGELRIKGEISFDFLSEEEIVQMLSMASVIYLPQHDFQHYATSGSARLAISTGRLVIVPPYRPFHDLAGGVMFADRPRAIEIVKSMKASPIIARRYGKAGHDFKETFSIGQMYVGLARDLMDNVSWTGGRFDGVTRHLHVNVTELETIIASNLVTSPQNLACLVKFGLGQISGKFIDLSPFPSLGRDAIDAEAAAFGERSTLGTDQIDELEIDLDERYRRNLVGRKLEQKLDTFAKHRSLESGLSVTLNRKNEIRRTLPTTERRVGSDRSRLMRCKSDEMSAAFQQGDAQSFLTKALNSRRDRWSELRMIRGHHAAFVSVLWLLELPCYAQALYLLLEAELSIDQTIALVGPSANMDPAGHDDSSCLLIFLGKLIALKTLASETPLLARRLLWSSAVLEPASLVRCLVYPESLLAFDRAEFVISAYRTILGRDPERAGFIYQMKCLHDGASMSVLAFDMASSSEGTTRQIELAESVEYWTSKEVLIHEKSRLVQALAPLPAARKADNLAIIDRLYSAQLTAGWLDFAASQT